MKPEIAMPRRDAGMKMYEPFKPTDEHPNLLHYVWFEKLKFCGCGSPETVLRHLRDAMRALQDRSDAWKAAPAFGGWTPADADRADRERHVLGGGERGGPAEYGPFYYMTAYLLNAADLTEHGGSVPGWLTDFGREVLACLETTDEAGWDVYLEGYFAEGADG